MDNDKLFKRVKTALRVTIEDDQLDTEINDLITSARADLSVNGTLKFKESSSNEALIIQAVILYVKGNWGYDNPDSQALLTSYDLLKNKLALASQYRESGIKFVQNGPDGSDDIPDNEGYIEI